MEIQTSRRFNRVGVDENTLAIIDATDSLDTQDANDDRIAFLEAVRVSFIASDNGTPPTNKIYEAVFHILRICKSLELIMGSYLLLNKLDKRFHRVYRSKLPSNDKVELVVVDEAWSPFVLMDCASNEKELAGKKSSAPIDSTGFHKLIQDLAEVVIETNLQAADNKSLGNMLLFQYLVSVLDGDFVPRNCMYNETMNWTLLRESLLNMLLGSRRINYKALIKDCLSILCGLFHVCAERSDTRSPENPVAKSSDDYDKAVAIASIENLKSTSTAMQKLLVMIMELDASRKIADMESLTSRADGVRTPLVEIILDELTYNRDILSPFLQVFNEPKWKGEIILQYFLKYIVKPTVRTRRSNGSPDEATFNGVLKSFSNSTSTKSMIKKIDTEAVQLLLAHAFQAHFALLSSLHDDGIFDSEGEMRGTSFAEICKNIISAFESLRRTDKNMEILPLGREALFTAGTKLSMNFITHKQ
ncbi:hypothetical protein CFOL_v3_30463 [Cephalotus follicularis]|uniref:Uncharacterized protein n=1 Tax=Cephalotus follicularis TaxID=3775 RepID=A0A1Q3D3G0_CEPFO|nr:hypothetical protein CFOL_v3_30463 [Cephalotus follicularis]